MPRRRPGAVRALLPIAELPNRGFSHIDGLSARTQAELIRWESRTRNPGEVARALRIYRAFLSDG
ncbi:hypothetical protein [Alloactinosynnema sp. L-07]|uniref:hypothetical protein n=1 Tax=Alloactinosynnema sp. L-07 TaxID=1653480 RepID=UPI00065EFBBE|nr:hypothetical protein [Alloactinosynnema sp. L-07]CRK61219.1 hypothetical protein [Alloactinosynnema sp. L-07]